MLSRKFFAVSVLLSAGCFLCPWFTFNAEIAGYYWGLKALPYVSLFYCCIVWYYTLERRSPISVLLMEISLVAIPLVMVWAYFRWPLAANIGHIGFSEMLRLGERCIQQPYWVGLAASVASLLLFQLEFVPRPEAEAA